MISFIIENNGEIKEAFGYELPFNEPTQQSIIQYARARYGPDAMVHNVTNEERSQDGRLVKESYLMMAASYEANQSADAQRVCPRPVWAKTSVAALHRKM